MLTIPIPAMATSATMMMYSVSPWPRCPVSRFLSIPHLPEGFGGGGATCVPFQKRRRLWNRPSKRGDMGTEEIRRNPGGEIGPINGTTVRLPVGVFPPDPVLLQLLEERGLGDPEL